MFAHGRGGQLRVNSIAQSLHIDDAVLLAEGERIVDVFNGRILEKKVNLKVIVRLSKVIVSESKRAAF